MGRVSAVHTPAAEGRIRNPGRLALPRIANNRDPFVSMLTTIAFGFLTLFAPTAASTIGTQPISSEESPWGRFRGPNGSGVLTDGSALPDVIGPEDNLLWRVDLPGGYSSPVLTPERVFVTAVDGVDLLTFCFDRGTGAELWSTASPQPLEAPHRNVNSPAAPSPATDGKNVYVFFQRNGLLSYDEQGELRWQTQLDEFNIVYGVGTSPILAGDRLILQCDHDGDSYLLALDKDTGRELWRTERPGKTHGFSTPTIYEPQEGPTEIIVSGSYQVIGYDASNGEKLWWVDGMAWQAKCVPVIAGDTAFVSSWMATPTELGAKPVRVEWAEALEEFDADRDGSLTKKELSALSLDDVWFLYDLDKNDTLDEEEWGYAVARTSAKNGLFAIRLGGRGNVTDSHVLWRFRRSLPNIPSPLLFDGRLFVLKEGGVLMALDPSSGEILQDGRVEGALDTYYASPVAGDGKLITASQQGLVAVIDGGAEWRVLSVRDFGEEIWATPALGAGQVFVRTMAGLYCFAQDAPRPEKLSAKGEAAGLVHSDWPGWRGPQRDGIAREASWNPIGAPEPLWQKKVGLGYSGFAVGNGRFFTLGFDEESSTDRVWCLDALTGEVLWQYSFPAAKWNKYHGGGTNTTPTLDGETLYALNREGKLHCLDAVNGELKWQVNLIERFDVELPTWGFAASPVVVAGDLLINAGRALLLDKTTGEKRWVSEDFGHAYSTPALFEHDGKQVLALFNGRGLAVLDFSDGSQLAFREWKVSYDVNAASPIVIGDNLFISSGYNKGAALLTLGPEGLETVWESRVMRNKMSGCIQIGDFLYGFDESQLKCINLAGELQWSERGLGNGAVSGAFSGEEQRVLVMTGKGELLVLAANPESFTVLSRAAVIDSDGVFWTMPILVKGLIYCRDSKGNLVCLDHRPE